MAEDNMNVEQEKPTGQAENTPEQNLPHRGIPRRGFLQLAGGTLGALGLTSLIGPSKAVAAPLAQETTQTPTTEVAGVMISQLNEAEIQLFKDKGVEYGRFFMETGNLAAKTGFVVQDYENGPKFWSAFQRLGGVDTLGYPISYPFKKDGFTYQLFQGGVLQENPNEGSPDGMVLANSMDILKDIENQNPAFAQQLRFEGVPAHKPGENISGAERLTWIDPEHYQDPRVKEAIAAIRETYRTIGGQKMSVEDAALIRGYPTSEFVLVGPFGGVRLQRGALQYWYNQLPGGPEPGSVSPFLSGDLLKRGGWPGKDYLALAAIALGPALAYQIPKEQNPETPINVEVPFPKEFGDLAKDGIVFHNMGDKVGLKLNDPQFLTDYLDPLAKAARPGGLEIFAYNTSVAAEAGFFKDPKYILDPKYKGTKIENYVPNETLSLSVNESQYFDRTTVWVLKRPDGVAEIHFSLILKPDTQLDSKALASANRGLVQLLTGYIAGDLYDIPEKKRISQYLGDRIQEVYRNNSTEPMPITAVSNSLSS